MVNVRPVAVHPYFSGQLSFTLKWEQQKMLAGHQGISSTLSWVTHTQKLTLFFWSLCLNCGKFSTMTIYGSSHYRILYVCQIMQIDRAWNYIFHLDKRVSSVFIFHKACFAIRLQSLSCQYTSLTDPSSKWQMVARSKYIIYHGQVQRNEALLSNSSFS